MHDSWCMILTTCGNFDMFTREKANSSYALCIKDWNNINSSLGCDNTCGIDNLI